MFYTVTYTYTFVCFEAWLYFAHNNATKKYIPPEVLKKTKKKTAPLT